MFESDQLNVYYYSKTSGAFTFTPQKQAHVLVAVATQKRAAELFDCTPNDIAQYGGVTSQRPVQAMCRAEPEVVFVELSNGEYIRLADISDLSKKIKLDMREAELHGYEFENAAFGTIRATRFSGDTDMFMVDYPQGHGISLSISTAVLNRNAGSDRVFDRDEIIRIELSEVQWARMLSSLNAGSVPCTLRRYRDPSSGTFLTPKMPAKHAADMETFRAEVEKRAENALTDVTAARRRLAELMQKGPLRKGAISEVIEVLERAERDAARNMPYVTERAHETIHTAAQHAKAEVDAHVDYAMMKLGERALGDRLAQALESGVDLVALGKGVSAMIAPPKED